MNSLIKVLANSLEEETKTKKSSKSSKPKREPNYFGCVNSKYPALLEKFSIVVKLTLDIKRKAIEDCISKVRGITEKEYKTKLRDTMMEFVLNLSFLMECRELGLEPFAAAQNMVILYRHKKALKDGIKEAFNNDFKFLKEPLFTEAELADAKFNGVEGIATKAQRKQLSLLIERAMSILPNEEDESKGDSDK